MKQIKGGGGEEEIEERIPSAGWHSIPGRLLRAFTRSSARLLRDA